MLYKCQWQLDHKPCGNYPPLYHGEHGKCWIPEDKSTPPLEGVFILLWNPGVFWVSGHSLGGREWHGVPHCGWTRSVVSISFFWWTVRDSCAASNRAVICQVSEGSAVEWAIGISVAGSGIKGSLPLSWTYQYTSAIFTKRQHCKGAANWQINSILKTLWGVRHWLSCTDFGNQSLCLCSIYPNKLWILKVSFYQFSKSWCIGNFK